MILTALILGFLGSWHCAGMCCPLTMIVNRNAGLGSKIFYNTSRVLVYGGIGTVAATTGSLPIIKSFHTSIILLFGIIFILLSISLLFKVNSFKNFQIESSFTRFVYKTFGAWVKKKSFLSPIVLGAMNGFLPCGLVYLAAAYCFVLTPVDGFYFMLFFGLGTWPVMIGWSTITQAISKYISYQKIKIAMFLIAGVSLLGRGLTMKMDKGHLTINTVTTVCE